MKLYQFTAYLGFISLLTVGLTHRDYLVLALALVLGLLCVLIYIEGRQDKN